MKKQKNLRLKLDVDVEYEFLPGTDSRFSRDFGHFLPGEPPAVKIISVEFGSYDLLSQLDKEEVFELEQAILESEE
jgi:hypothetical protein